MLSTMGWAAVIIAAFAIGGLIGTIIALRYGASLSQAEVATARAAERDRISAALREHCGVGLDQIGGALAAWVCDRERAERLTTEQRIVRALWARHEAAAAVVRDPHTRIVAAARAQQEIADTEAELGRILGVGPPVSGTRVVAMAARKAGAR